MVNDNPGGKPNFHEWEEVIVNYHTGHHFKADKTEINSENIIFIWLKYLSCQIETSVIFCYEMLF